MVKEGEQGRGSFFTFVRDRMDGFADGPGEARVLRDFVELPSVAALTWVRQPRTDAVGLRRVPGCVGPVVWRGPAAIDRELARFDAAAAAHHAGERFLTLPSPGIVASAMANHHDATLDEYVDAVAAALAEAQVGSLVLALANPRHAHEVRLLGDERLRRFRVVAGVIETTHNYVEHPEVVADRIGRVVEAVGDRSLVSAGTDCGFATAAGVSDVAPEVAWRKLMALAEGTAIANERLGLA